ncbi:MAG: transporter [bacterium]
MIGKRISNRIGLLPVYLMILGLALACRVEAHHGVVSLGVAGLTGPGAPLETSSSATLPTGSWLGYLKLDHAIFETYTAAVDDEGKTNTFWMFGLGFGARSWLSLYAFTPFYAKRAEDNSFNSAGFADMSLMGVFGFKYDGRLRLVPEHESLDDLEDWHFTLSTGLTLPTGDENLTAASGDIDPGKSLGFGEPSYSLGLTATKQLFRRLTLVHEVSWITFQEHQYADGQKVRFGDELRLNSALAVRMVTDESSQLRLDGNLEANYLQLGRDEADGMGEDATGGKILYVVPGLRLTRAAVSFGIGYKLPIWTELNEEDAQQGAEGKEKGRVIFAFSTIF